MAFPSRPASPTLTNPDMILPYGEYDSTPSPPRHANRPVLPETWKASSGVAMDFGFGQPAADLGPSAHVAIGRDNVTPTTPIIYGNGTMLSDIGEVTEAESTPGRKPSSARIARGGDLPLRSSPTTGYDAVKKRSKFGSHQRTASSGSSSTVTTEGQAAEMHFDGFDDSVSVDDSNFQGDDEESVADDGYEQHVAIAQPAIVARSDSIRVKTLQDEDTSSAALSRKAELILANAKKRLDSMEGNLSRARNSLYITPSSSMSSINSSSPLSRLPPNPASRIVPQLGMPPSRHRQISNGYPSPTSPGHSRVFSENSIPSSLQSNAFPARSLSALGSGPLGAVDPKLRELRLRGDQPQRSAADPARQYSSSLLIRTIPIKAHIAPLDEESEDDDTPMHDSFADELQHARSSTAEPYQQPTSEHRGLTRSSSSMQMRDLTDKMKDLKGKISTLRERAREDTMKRRSLQSLRTPSPFTAAEQWYHSAKEYTGTGLSADAGVTQNPWNTEPRSFPQVDEGEISPTPDIVPRDPAEGTASEAETIYEDVHEALSENSSEPMQPSPAHIAELMKPPEDIEEDAAELKENVDAEEEVKVEEEAEAEDEDEDEADESDYIEEFVDHDELDDYPSEDDSTYHDTRTTPVSHEDREDAFDYEHFFLHSAMGTISQERLARRGSIGSFSSDASVETARGPTPPPKDLVTSSDRPIYLHQKSADSVSSMGSFATANEVQVDSEEDDDAYGARMNEPPLSAVFQSDNPIGAKEKTATFGSFSKNTIAERTSTPETGSRPNSVLRNGIPEQPVSLHRPSISSITSTGSTRSFPLVNRPKSSGLTPPPQNTHQNESRDATNLTMSEAMSLVGGPESPSNLLPKGDQILLERLVAGLGKCVLGLQEAGRGGSEGRMWRRRLDMARKVLEGEETQKV